MSRPIRLGIIGLGFGEKVQIPAFRTFADVAITAVASQRLANAERVAQTIPAAKAFAEWNDLVASPEVDAISIVTPPMFHREIALAAIRAGKHVLCEKPFGMTVAEAEEIEYAARGRPELVCGVDFEFRFEPGFQTLKHGIESGMVGDLRRIDVSWLTSGRSSLDLAYSWQNDREAGGGVAGAFVSHVLDYLAWFGGSSIAALSGRKTIAIPQRRDTGGMPRNVTAEDGCEAEGQLASGVRIGLQVSNVVPEGTGHLIRIEGDKGRLEHSSVWPFDLTKSSVRFVSIEGNVRELPLDISDLGDSDSRILPFRRLAARFLGSIREGRLSPELPSFSDGVRARQALHFLGE